MRSISTQSKTLLVTHQTSLDDLRAFAGSLTANTKIRGKLQPDGSYLLKTSTKGSGTGANDFFFGTVRNRRDTARIAIWKIANNSGSAVLASAMKEQMGSDGELTAGSLGKLLAPISSETEWNPSIIDDLEVLNIKIEETNDGKSKPHHFFTDVKKRMNLIANGEKPERPQKEKDELAKIWARSQLGIDLYAGRPTPEGKEFNAITQDFLEKMDGGSSIFQCNAGLGFLNLGVAIDMKINQNLDEMLTSIAKKDRDSAISDIKRYATDCLVAKQQHMDKIRYGASLLTNGIYLQKIPKDKRVTVGQIGNNLAMLYAKFEDPKSEFQALMRLMTYAERAPEEFLDLAQEQLHKTREQDKLLAQKAARKALQHSNLAVQREIMESKLAAKQESIERAWIRKVIWTNPSPSGF